MLRRKYLHVQVPQVSSFVTLVLYNHRKLYQFLCPPAMAHTACAKPKFSVSILYSWRKMIASTQELTSESLMAIEIISYLTIIVFIFHPVLILSRTTYLEIEIPTSSYFNAPLLQPPIFVPTLKFIIHRNVRVFHLTQI